ncbi:hypothetical protein DQ354_16785 [Arthrobacter sp. AQ5-06]|nr:hypothetical protein DQ354_16785 [Arthrobacter sp. AQ5-06]
MLWKLLVEYLRPHRQLLIDVVVFQLAQSIASLYLPTLNADIIDDGNGHYDTDVTWPPSAKGAAAIGILDNLHHGRWSADLGHRFHLH